MKKLFLAVMATALLSSITANAIELPWSVSTDAPAMMTDPLTLKRKEVRHNQPNPLIWLIRGFQNFISPVDGDRCTSYPTCSGYGVHALRKHGPLMGFIMTADRVLHETDEHLFAPRIVKFGRIRIYDPVERNDFWWTGE